ncbi:MAG: phosphotransferase, partial [Chloroflexi bacterium]|nr:phosphotransferase [Chloroflexota bacterium]
NPPFPYSLTIPFIMRLPWHGDYRLDNCFFAPTRHRKSLIVMDWEFCGQGRGAYDVGTFVSEAFPPQDRKKAESGLLREYHSALEDRGVKGYSFEECLHDYRVSMLELLIFWIVTGGYCNYESARAKTYLRNTLERLDAAIRDLDSTETVGLKL